MAQSAPPRGYAHILTLKACQYELTHNKGLYSLNIKWPPHSHVPPKKINFSPKKETLLISFSIDKTNPEITLGQEGGLRLGGPMETLTMGMSCTALAPPSQRQLSVHSSPDNPALDPVKPVPFAPLHCDSSLICLDTLG